MSKCQEGQPQAGHNLFIEHVGSKSRWAIEGAPDALIGRCPESDRLSPVAPRATPCLQHHLHSNSTVAASVRAYQPMTGRASLIDQT